MTGFLELKWIIVESGKRTYSWFQRYYYNQIAVNQEKVFEKISESLKQFISDLNDTLENFDNLDTNIANNFEE